MGNILGATFVTIVVLFLVARLVLALSAWPTLSAQVWPWMRMRPWWPVPAERAAESLLHEMLSPQEYRQLCYSGFLDVPSPSRPTRTYRVPRGPGQVLVLDNSHITERLCVQPATGGLPEADVVLMHKLLIQADEDTYLQTANHFPRSVWH